MNWLDAAVHSMLLPSMRSILIMSLRLFALTGFEGCIFLDNVKKSGVFSLLHDSSFQLSLEWLSLRTFRARCLKVLTCNAFTSPLSMTRPQQARGRPRRMHADLRRSIQHRHSQTGARRDVRRKCSPKQLVSPQSRFDTGSAVCEFMPLAAQLAPRLLPNPLSACAQRRAAIKKSFIYLQQRRFLHQQEKKAKKKKQTATPTPSLPPTSPTPLVPPLLHL